MELKKTDDLGIQIGIGKAIVSGHPEIYQEGTKASIYQLIDKLKGDSPLSTEELFYISIYDYWLYGFTTEEVFYLNLLDKSEAEKEEYISHMDRINYMHHLNRGEDEHLLTNKFETYNLLRDYYGRKVIYIDYSSDISEFLEFFSEHDEFVIKPIGLATSIGVRKVSRKDYGYDGRAAFESILSEIGQIQSRIKWAKGFGVIVEEVIQQGEALSRLHKSSVNSVRLTTIRHGDDIHIFYPVLRIGMGGEFLCSGAVGSILTGINVATGITETDGYNEWNEHYIVHPNTGVSLRGIPIPKWEELCDIAKEIASKFDSLRYIGWDFVYTAEDKWVVMEGNENGEFLGQIAYQRGLLKEFQKLIQWRSSKDYWWIGKYDKV